MLSMVLKFFKPGHGKTEIWSISLATYSEYDPERDSNKGEWTRRDMFEGYLIGPCVGCVNHADDHA